jgi:hypothetical protein
MSSTALLQYHTEGCSWEDSSWGQNKRSRNVAIIVRIAVEVMDEFEIGSLERKIRVGSQLSPPIKESLVAFLRDKADVFSWSHEDMTGIDPSVLTHRMNVDLSHQLVKKKGRSFDPVRNLAISEEVEKLLQAGFI